MLFRPRLGLPGPRYWLFSALLIASIGAVGLQLAPVRGWLPNPPITDAGTILLVTGGAFVLPALFEELVFRGLLIPTIDTGIGATAAAAAIVLSLVLYVLWHPVVAWLVIPKGRPFFLDPVFLGVVTALGAGCTWLYRASASLWPSVLAHGALVAGWKIAGGPRLTL